MNSINGNKHLEVVNELTKELQKHFPSSGIAIAGSVAENKHNSKSDIDLLLVDETIKRNRQFTFNRRGIDINLFCINPQLIKMQIEVWQYLFNCQQVNYINSAKIIYDSDGLVKSLQQLTEQIISKKKSSDAELLKNLDTKIDSLKKNINENKQSFSLLSEFLRMLISKWFIIDGISLDDKNAHNESFLTIEKQDKELYKLVNTLLLNSFNDVSLFDDIDKYIQQQTINDV